VTSLVHVHGTSDPIVPLSGRAIRETWQGDVGEALAMYRRLGGFGAAQPPAPEGLDCESWRNAKGAVLDFCLHPGGHSLRTGYLGFGLERLRAAGRI